MKNQKGVTLIILVITIILLLILTFTISVNVTDISNRKRKTNFENDIKALKEEIDQYYAKNESLPIINKYTNIELIKNINENDNENYYVIDLSKIKVSLNYGKDYNKIVNEKITGDILNLLDIYIVNEQSHTIYYPKGILYDNVVKYTLDSYSKIDATLNASIQIEKIDNQNVKLVAKAVDIGNVGINSYEFYINNELKETKQIANNTAEYKFTTTFGDYTAYVKVKNKEGKIYKTEEKTFSDYIIETPEELKIFRDNVNTGNTYKDKKIKLANDIDLTNICSTTAGTWKPIDGFEGTFDGQENTIKNIYIKEDGNNKGLFAQLQGTVENLNITGSITGNTAVAGIAGINNGSIENCKNYCEITNTNSYIGGISGNNSGIIKECINYGKITGVTYVGGIAGANAEGATIEQCLNKAEVSSTGNSNETSNGTGGISGSNQGNIESTYNRGKVTGTSTQVGGITGWQGLNTGNVKNSYNTAEITGQNTIGGIIGVVGESTVKTQNIYSTATAKITGETNYSTETIGNSNNNYLGTIIGRKDYDAISDNYMAITHEIASTWTNENIKTYLGENFIKDVNNNNDGYPILKWQQNI